MATVRIGLRFVTPTTGLFSPVLDVLARPFGGDRASHAIKILRASVAQEFEGGYWLRPDGGQTGWKEVREFGSRPAPESPLGGSDGFLAQAWQGMNAFGGEEKTDTMAAITVTHPAAPVHRGGDVNPSDSYETKIGVTEKMRRFLGLEYGVWMKQEEITIPARPHATTNPKLEENLATMFGRVIAAAASGVNP